MFTSKYSDSQKRDIVEDRTNNCLTVRTICDKYDITPQTFYAWQKKFTRLKNQHINKLEDFQLETPENENKLLRQLYVELSAHNYQLAKFLEK